MNKTKEQLFKKIGLTPEKLLKCGIIVMDFYKTFKNQYNPDTGKRGRPRKDPYCFKLQDKNFLLQTGEIYHPIYMKKRVDWREKLIGEAEACYDITKICCINNVIPKSNHAQYLTYWADQICKANKIPTGLPGDPVKPLIRHKHHNIIRKPVDDTRITSKFTDDCDYTAYALSQCSRKRR